MHQTYTGRDTQTTRQSESSMTDQKQTLHTNLNFKCYRQYIC